MKYCYKFYPHGPEDWDWFKVWEDDVVIKCEYGCLPKGVMNNGMSETPWVKEFPLQILVRKIRGR